MVLNSLARLAWRPFADSPIHVEQYVDGDNYVIRAELPGLDPARHIHLAVIDGELRIRAERATDERTNGHSEFRYGPFYRGVALPRTAKPDAVSASYDRGILEVRVALDTGRPRGHDIAIAQVAAGHN